MYVCVCVCVFSQVNLHVNTEQNSAYENTKPQVELQTRDYTERKEYNPHTRTTQSKDEDTPVVVQKLVQIIANQSF